MQSTVINAFVHRSRMDSQPNGDSILTWHKKLSLSGLTWIG